MESQQHVFVAEITCAVDDAGTLETHYACSGEGFATRPGDTPANTPIAPTLMDPGRIDREMFSGDKPFGRARSSFGEVILTNVDGRYDAWEHHGFDGRPFVLRWGPLGGAYPADFHTILICTMDGLELTHGEARLNIRDNTQLLDKAFLNEAFKGDSTAEGADIGIAGQAKSRYIGAPRWYGPQPQLISEAWGKTIYHLTTGQLNSVRVWDNGNELVLENATSDFWSYAAAVSPYHFWLHFENGSSYMRLGSRAVGDVRVYASTFQNDGSQWNMQALLMEAGYTGELVGDALPGINVVVADSGVTYARVFDDAATTAGMFYGFDRLGRFVSKPFDEPTGEPVATLTRANCISIKRSPVQGMEVPLYQISANVTQTWKSNYTAPVNYVRHQFLAEQWLNRFTYSDDKVLVKHPAAKSLKLDLLIGPREWMTWAVFYDRYMRMFGVDRSTITATVPLTAQTLAIDLGDCVKVVWPRFNLTNGRLFRVVSVHYSLKSRQIEFALWG